MQFLRQISIFLFGMLAVSFANAELKIAAAANFAPVLPALAAAFKAESGIDVAFSTAATGSLFAQINNGAPFAALISADHDTAVKIARSERGIIESLTTVTCGELVLWGKRNTITDGNWLAAHTQDKIAIANPQTAPYGKAAAETLDKLAWRGVRVQAENIAQAYQFSESGNVAAAFIANSHYQAGKLSGGWKVPANYHQPLVHSAVVTRNVSTEDQQQAQQFLTFLRTDAAQRLLIEAGYRRCESN